MSDQRWIKAFSALRLRGGLLLAAGVSLAVNLGNLGAYLFQVALSHSLSKSDYGQFNVLFAIVLILLTPSPAIAIMIVNLHRSQNVSRAWTIDAVVIFFTLLSATLALSLLLGLELLGFFSAGLRLGSSLLFFLSALQMVAIGVRQAARRHRLVTLAQTSVGLLRAVLVGLLIGAGVNINVSHAVWICVLAAGVSVILLVPPRQPKICVSYLQNGFISLTRNYPEVYKTVTPLFFGYVRLMIAFAVLQNGDLLVVYLRWSGSAAGDYAGASVLARIGFLIPSSLFTLGRRLIIA